MPLSVGTRLGPYEVVSALGAGGMGEVYRARDTRLDREVAVKIVPELFASDPERLVRFEREAKTLASLNHPNIAQIHGIEGADIVRALVMEYIDGEDLSQRIAQGPIPLDEALPIARQLADALEAAHERNIIHRDLKPANIKIRSDGTVKVLDFGLSKALDPRTSTPNLSQSPTFTSPATQLGVILGTAAYMAPEQAKGRAVDKRADIWAFGVVLFEMLAGRSPFSGETTTEVLAHIVSRDPDWNELPADTPAGVRRLLKRCLERDPKIRLRDIGDARFELIPRGDEPPAVAATTTRRPWLIPALAVALLAALLAAVAGWTIGGQRAPSTEPTRRFGLSGLSLLTDAYQTIALSPDGRHLAYRALGVDGIDRIFVRPLDAIEPQPVAGSDGGRLPFFSPDGTQLAFFAAGHLRRTTIGTGSPRVVVALRGTPLGGTWLDDGSIVFVDSVRGVMRVPGGGNAAETVRPADKGDVVTPWGLPGSRALLVAVRGGSESHVAVLSLADGSLRPLVSDAWAPAWSPATGLIFSQGESLVRLPFDVQRLTATGAAAPAVSGVRTRFSVQSRPFGLAADGTVAYVPVANGGSNLWSLAWVDRTGRESPIVDVGGNFDNPRLSPDGTHLAFRRPAPNCDLWSLDLTRGSTTRLTLEGDNHGPAWSEDGTRVTFTRNGEPPRLLSVAADGGAAEQVGDPRALAFLGRQDVHLTAWRSRSGDALVRTAEDTYAVSRNAEPKLLGHPAFEDAQAVFSPDGGHVAYASDESGRLEVYVQSYPGGAPRFQVSTEGGSEPVWARSGKELFFRQGRRLFVVDVATSAALALGRPKLLFTGNYLRGSLAANYDVSKDGTRFVMVKGPTSAGHDEIVVVLNAFPGAGR